MTAPRCPTCNTRLNASVRSSPFPFCSRKCKLVDLGRWLDGEYVIAEALGADSKVPQEQRPEREDEGHE